MIINSFWGWMFIITAAIVVIQLIMSVVNGTDLDIDIDGDGVGDFDLGTIVSPKGILHFIFGGSGYLTIIGPEKWNFKGYLIALAIGLVVAGIMFLVYWGMSKLADEKKQEEGEVMVGRSGTVYLPTDTPGVYEITVVRNEREQHLVVTSKSGKKYKTGKVVSIVAYESGVYYIE
jgi:hypothetical protein